MGCTCLTKAEAVIGAGMKTFTTFWRSKRRQQGAEHLTKDLSVFWPNSTNFAGFPELTYQAANRLPRQLVNIAEMMGGSSLRVTPVDQFAESTGESALRSLFEEHGSDKSEHGYHSVYSKIISNLGRNRDLSILEIGLGTNNPGLISTMGAKGSPGASLRAFRDYCPAAKIYGADIDPEILFSDERIKTALVDQTAPQSFEALTRSIENTVFDLVIDDGLHSSEANLNTLSFGITHLAPGGWIVVEDIPRRSIDIWKLVARLLPQSKFTCTLVEAQKEIFLFVVQKGGT
jgi:hypothetical protein